jgi:hypothetical protein
MDWLGRTILLSNHNRHLCSDPCFIFVDTEMALERTLPDFLGGPIRARGVSPEGPIFPAFSGI